ncbi:MAG: hypothetical protein AAGD14_03045 [Planctomycetota bacterium]
MIPKELEALLDERDGYVEGALHVRGRAAEPAWHSLEEVWKGEHALHRLYRHVKPTDVPFAQDCLGDQFLLRDGAVHRLEAETGDIEQLADDLGAFLAMAAEDPQAILGSDWIEVLEKRGGKLEPGQSIHVYPPFVAKESEDGVTLNPIDTLELLRWHADFARQIEDVADGESIEIEFD